MQENNTARCFPVSVIEPADEEPDLTPCEYRDADDDGKCDYCDNSFDDQDDPNSNDTLDEGLTGS